MTRAVVWDPHRDPSSFYRLTEPARVLGVPVVESVDAVGHADTIITNRPILPYQRAVIELWAEEGRRVVVDLDDDFDAIPPGHAMYGRHSTRHLHAACEAAAMVTCSTPALAARFERAVTLRNGIPDSLLTIRRAGRRYPRPWVGWYASLASHPHDAPQLGDAVAKAFAEVTDAEFVYAGPTSDEQRLGGILGVPPRMLGFFSMQGLMRVIAEFDVGVVPLERSPFNQAKSWLKALEMAAVGVPAIASPTDEYTRMAQLGGCTTAARPEDWFGWLVSLLTDEDLRREKADRGYRFASTQTYERRADEWRAIWFG